jgi:hypothetical protein
MVAAENDTWVTRDIYCRNEGGNGTAHDYREAAVQKLSTICEVDCCLTLHGKNLYSDKRE